MGRPVVINVQVNDTNSAAVTAKLRNNFSQVADTAGRVAPRIAEAKQGLSGFERVGTHAVSAVDRQFSQLLSRVPLLGQPLAAITRELFNMGKADPGAKLVKNMERQLETLSRLKERAAQIDQRLQNARGDFASKLSKQFGGKIDTDFLRQYSAAQGEDRFRLLKPKFNSTDRLEKIKPQIDQASEDFAKLERNGVQALSSIEKKVAEGTNALAEMEAGTEAVAGGFTALVNPITIVLALVLALAVAVGVGTGALFAASNSAANYADEIYKAGKRTQFTTEALSALKVAAVENDVPFDSISRGVARFEKNLVDASRGIGNSRAYFKAFGIDAKQAVKDPEAAYDQFLKRLNEMPPSAKTAAAAIALMGKDAANALPALTGMGGGLEEAKKKAQAMGLLLTKQQTQDLHNYKVALRDLGLNFTGLGNKIGAEFAPVATRAIRTFTVVLQSVAPVVRYVALGFGVFVNFVIDGLIRVVAAAQTVPVVVRELANVVAVGAQSFVHFGEAAKFAGEAIFYALVANDPTSAALAIEKAYAAAGAAAADYARQVLASGARVREEYRKNRDELRKTFDAKGSAYGDDVDLPDKVKKQRGETESQLLDRQLTVMRAHQRDLEESYQDELDEAKLFYERHVTSLADFVETEKALAKVRLTGLNQSFAEERLAIQKSGILQDQKDAKLAEVDERAHQAQREFNKATNAADREQYDKEMQSANEHRRAFLDRQKAFDDARVAQLRDDANERVLTHEEAEKRIGEIELAALRREAKELLIQRALAGNNLELQKQINDALAQLDEEYRAREAANSRATRDAHDQDLKDLQEFNASLRSLQAENDQLRLDITGAGVARDERLGVKAGALRREHAMLDRMNEDRLYKQHTDEIEAARKSIALMKDTDENKAKLTAIYEERERLEAARHADAMREINERPLVEYLAKVRRYATQAGDIVGGAFADLFEKGRSFWKDMEDGFRQMFQQIVRDFVASKVKEVIEALFTPKQQQNASANNHSSGGGFSLKNILGGARSIFGGGNNNEDEGGGSSSSPGGLRGVITNFSQNGFKGGLKNLVGFGGGAAPATASAGGAAALGSAGTGLAGLLGGHGAASVGAAGKAGTGGASSLAHLGAFMTNPYVLAAVAAGVTAFALWKHFSHGTEKKLREAIRGAYQVDVKDMKTLSEIKQIGESAFGKGQVSKHLGEVVKLDQVKEIVEQYAASTGQNSTLADNKKLSEITDPRNQFTRFGGFRANGGDVRAGQRYIVGDAGRPEWFIPDVDGTVEPTVPDDGGGVWRRMKAARKRAASGAQSSAPLPANQPGAGAGAGLPPSVATALVGALTRVHEVLDSFEAEDENALFKRQTKNNPRAIMDGVHESLGQGYKKREVQKGLNLA